MPENDKFDVRDQRRIVHSPRSTFTNNTLLERMLPYLAELVRGNELGCTPAQYVSRIHVECQEDTLRHKHFLDFLKSVVGKDPFERFTEQPYEIAYLIHPLYISVSVTGTMGESGDSFSSTSVFNFPIQMLNKALD